MQDMQQRLEELIGGDVAKYLVEQCLAAYNKLTAEERAELDHADRPARLPKVLLNAVAKSPIIDRQFGSEGATKDVARVRRINNKR